MTAGGDREVVCFGEILARCSTEAGGRGLAFADRLFLHIGGAEANVAVALATLGHPAAMVSAVPEGPFGERAAVHLRSAGVAIRHLRRAPGRLGLYLVDTGASLSRSRVIYDRAGSLFAETDWRDFDWRSALTDARLLHVSGIALAVSDHVRRAAIAAMRVANELGVPVAFDGNFRALLWAGREAESGPAVADALALADLAFVDYRDAALALGRAVAAEDGPATLFDAFPRLRLVAHTWRQMTSVEEHRLSARVSLRDGADVVTSEQRIPGVVDRIGGGDAFAAGVIHAWLEGGDAARMASTGLAAACLKHSQRGDALMTTRDVLDGFAGEALDVRR